MRYLKRQGRLSGGVERICYRVGRHGFDEVSPHYKFSVEYFAKKADYCLALQKNDVTESEVVGTCNSAAHLNLYRKIYTTMQYSQHKDSAAENIALHFMASNRSDDDNAVILIFLRTEDNKDECFFKLARHIMNSRHRFKFIDEIFMKRTEDPSNCQSITVVLQKELTKEILETVHKTVIQTIGRCSTMQAVNDTKSSFKQFMMIRFDFDDFVLNLPRQKTVMIRSQDDLNNAVEYHGSAAFYHLYRKPHGVKNDFGAQYRVSSDLCNKSLLFKKVANALIFSSTAQWADNIGSLKVINENGSTIVLANYILVGPEAAPEVEEHVFSAIQACTSSIVGTDMKREGYMTTQIPCKQSNGNSSSSKSSTPVQNSSKTQNTKNKQSPKELEAYKRQNLKKEANNLQKKQDKNSKTLSKPTELEEWVSSFGEDEEKFEAELYKFQALLASLVVLENRPSFWRPTLIINMLKDLSVFDVSSMLLSSTSQIFVDQLQRSFNLSGQKMFDNGFVLEFRNLSIDEDSVFVRQIFDVNGDFNIDTDPQCIVEKSKMLLEYAISGLIGNRCMNRIFNILLELKIGKAENTLCLAFCFAKDDVHAKEIMEFL